MCVGVCAHGRVHTCVCIRSCLPASGLGAKKDLDLAAGEPSSTGRKENGRLRFKMSSDLEVAMFY